MSRYTPMSAPCALCINCQNAVPTSPGDRRRRLRCAIGIDRHHEAFACESYVRMFSRGRATPPRAQEPPRAG